MEFNYIFNEEDNVYNESKNYLQDINLKRSLRIYYFTFLIQLIIFIIALVTLFIKGIKLETIFFIIGIFITILISIMKLRLLRMFSNTINKPFTSEDEEEITIIISEKGIIEKDIYNNELLYKWNNIDEVIISDKYIDIMMKKQNPLIIPLRVFNSKNSLNSFLEILRVKCKGIYIYYVK